MDDRRDRPGRSGRRNLKRPLEALETPADSKPSKKRPKTGPSDKAAVRVACPLHVKDPRTFFDCILFRFTRPGDVVQHLNRSHSLCGIYCADCFIEFATESDRDIHTRLRECIQRDPPPNVVLPGRLADLPAGTLVEKWFHIWDRIFPNQERPPPQSVLLFADWRDAYRVVGQTELNHDDAGPSASPALANMSTLDPLGPFYYAESNAVGDTANFGQSPAMQPEMYAPLSPPLATEGYGGPASSGEFGSALDGHDEEFPYGEFLEEGDPAANMDRGG